jgi:hypothetical protein
MSKDKLVLADPDDFRVIIITDGTTTTAEILVRRRQLGVGTARRRKGDRRDHELGESLALERAFRVAADRLAKTRRMLYGDLDG